MAVLGFHKNASLGFIDKLASLSIDRDNDGPLTRHVFEELGRNHGLEQLGLFQHDQAEIGSGNIGGNLVAWLLTEELNIGESTSSGQFHDPLLLRSFPNQQEHSLRQSSP